jgi:hypothetical protein
MQLLFQSVDLGVVMVWHEHEGTAGVHDIHFFRPFLSNDYSQFPFGNPHRFCPRPVLSTTVVVGAYVWKHSTFSYQFAQMILDILW